MSTWTKTSVVVAILMSGVIFIKINLFASLFVESWDEVFYFKELWHGLIIALIAIFSLLLGFSLVWALTKVADRGKPFPVLKKVA